MESKSTSAVAPKATNPETVQAQASSVPKVPMTTENSVVKRMAKAYGLQEKNLVKSLKSVIFHDPKVGDDEALAFLLVADKYGLDPWTRQIYPALTKQGAILPVVGVDGWLSILNNHPQMDGMEVIPGQRKPLREILTNYQDNAGLWIKLEAPTEITVKIYRKDRKYPIVCSESMAECFRNTEPWKTHPARMLRHKAIIQAARVAFGFSGIYDPDEAEGFSEVYKGPVTAVKKPIYEERGMTLETFVKAVIDRVQAKNAPLDAVLTYLKNPDFNLSKEDLEVAERMVANVQKPTQAVDDVFDVADAETGEIKQSPDEDSKEGSKEPTAEDSSDGDDLFGVTDKE